MSPGLDTLLDRIAAEAELKTGTPPGLVESNYPQTTISAHYAFITTNYSSGYLPWSPAQDDVIRQWYGRVSRAEMARRVNGVLHRELKTNEISRSHASIVCRAQVIGVHAYSGDDTELNIEQAARELEIGNHVIYQAFERGEFVTRRRGKMRYIKRRDLANWAVKLRERQLAQAEILNAVEGQDIISKKEAMELTGLGETHITRYLKTGVIKAWKLPDLTPGGGRGEWLVQRQSAETMAAARQKGRRWVRSLWTEEYRRLQQQNNALVEALRRDNPDFGRPDPLEIPGSKYHPRCFTVAQVASHMQRRTSELYDAIRAGKLKARTVKRGGRLRYAIAPEEARRYLHSISLIQNKAKKGFGVMLTIGSRAVYVGQRHPYLNNRTVQIVAICKEYFVDPDQTRIIRDPAKVGEINGETDMIEVQAVSPDGRLILGASDTYLEELQPLEPRRRGLD